MTAKHTPGPWTTSAVNKNEVLACGTGAARVAKCLDEFDDNPGGPKYGTGEVEANARLIAASPELLEALKACEEWHHGDKWRDGNTIQRGEWENHRNHIRAAIAKAEGGAE